MGAILPALSKKNDFPLPTQERHVRPLAQLKPEQQKEAWQRAAETAPEGKITTAHIQAIVDEMRAESSRPAWWQSSEDDDWWTPQWLFDLVDAEIGFETDVCASDANHKCARYFTREREGEGGIKSLRLFRRDRRRSLAHAAAKLEKKELAV